MGAISSRRANDVSFCWECVDRTRPLFRISQRFAPAGDREALLSLYAFFSSVEEAVSRPSERQVALSRLAWWRNELLEGDPRHSAHPVAGMMVRSGCLDRLPRTLLAEELHLAARRVDRDVVRTADDLAGLCAGLGANQLALELALAGAETKPTVEPPVGVRVTGLLQILRESLRSVSLGCWWLPLEFSARLGVTRDDGLTGLNAGRFGALMEALQNAVKAWRTPRRPGDDVRAFRAAGYDVSAVRHWLVHSGLQTGKFLRPATDPRALTASLHGRIGPLDAITAWRISRRIRA